MNEFYEAVANLLEELRCDMLEKDYAVAPEDWKEAEAELKCMGKKKERYFEKLPDSDKAFWEEYLEVLEHSHFKEEQRSYYQGMMDGILMLGGLGLIKRSGNVKKLIEIYKR